MVRFNGGSIYGGGQFREGEWSCYGGFNGGRKVMFNGGRNGHVTEVASLMEGE